MVSVAFCVITEQPNRGYYSFARGSRQFDERTSSGDASPVLPNGKRQERIRTIRATPNGERNDLSWEAGKVLYDLQSQENCVAAALTKDSGVDSQIPTMALLTTIEITDQSLVCITT